MIKIREAVREDKVTIEEISFLANAKLRKVYRPTKETMANSMLIIPGGTTWDEGKNTEIIEVVRMFIDSAKPVAAICGATAGLARARGLDNRKHTSNAREYLTTTHYKGAERYEENSAVTDNNLITAPAMAPVDFAYHIFKCLDIYIPPVLEAWYGLFKTGRSEYFGELMRALSTQGRDCPKPHMA